MPTIQLDHPVLFRALENTVESTVKDDIEAFHTELLEVSTVYARSVKKATSQKPVVVTVTHQPLAGGAAASSNSYGTRNYIDINPTVIINNALLRSASDARNNDARQALIFEMQNLASSRQFAVLDDLAISGHYEREVAQDRLPAVAKSLMRNEDDLPAVRFAVDVEKQEWENAKTLHAIAKKIPDSHTKYKLWDLDPVLSKFEEDLAEQIESGHAQGYLDAYDHLRRKG
jgi:hypothetical protein